MCAKKQSKPEEMNLLLPKSDLIFKLIFGDRRNIDILKGFLVATLDIPEQEYDTLSIIDPHLKREGPEDKLGILDVLVKTKEGKLIDVELQVLETPWMAERVTYYASKLLASQIASGQEFEAIKRVISIIILDYPLIGDSDNYHNRYRLYDEKNKSLFTDVLEINTLELSKLPESPVTQDGKSKELFYWLRFMKAQRKEEFEMAATQSPVIDKAYAVLKELSEDERTRMLYESREKARRDEYARLKGSYTKGIAEGMTKGIAEGMTKGIAKGNLEGRLDGARNLLAMGMDIEKIAKAMELSIEEVRKLMP